MCNKYVLQYTWHQACKYIQKTGFWLENFGRIFLIKFNFFGHNNLFLLVSIKKTNNHPNIWKRNLRVRQVNHTQNLSSIAYIVYDKKAQKNGHFSPE